MIRKRWSHISPDLINLLEDNTHNVVSLKVNFSEYVFVPLSNDVIPFFFLYKICNTSTTGKYKSPSQMCVNISSPSVFLHCSQIEDERKKSNFRIQRAFYDKKVTKTVFSVKQMRGSDAGNRCMMPSVIYRSSF